MKKIIVLSLVVGLLAGFGSVSFAQSNASLYLEIEKEVSLGYDGSNYVLNVGASTTFYISMYAKNMPAFCSFQFYIQYNSTKVPVPASSKFLDFVFVPPASFESSPIYETSTKIFTSSGSGVSTILNIASAASGDFTGFDIGDTWTFLGRLEFTTDATFTTNDSTLFNVTNARYSNYVGPGVDWVIYDIPSGNITNAGLNTTEIPIGPPAPIIAVSPTLLDFDYVHVDSTKSLPVLVINNGDTLLNVDSVQVPAGFSIDPQDSSGIAAGDTVTFTVTFTPTAQVEYTDSLMFFSNDIITGPVAVNVHGTAIVTRVISGPETVPGSYRLGPNYPNPFNPTTNIPFELKVNGRVTITVYNLIGQKVAEVVNGYYTAGIYTVPFNASGLGSGIYFYRMEANGFTDVKKFVYIR